MAISKGKRFDIFRRDAFTCRYCGQRPPDVVLEVDHIHPISAGGTDDDLNLVTACYDCNRGKKAKLLTDAAPRPDADLEFLAVQQEIAEIHRFIQAKEQRTTAQAQLIEALYDVWQEYLTPTSVPVETTMRRWLVRYTPEEIEAAIKQASFAYHARHITGGFAGLVRYVAGTLKRRQEAGE